MIAISFIPAAAGVGAALILATGRLDGIAWACYWIARARGGQWFAKRRTCGGCLRRVHIMRHSQDAASAGYKDGYLCCSCASGRSR